MLTYYGTQKAFIMARLYVQMRSLMQMGEYQRIMDILNCPEDVARDGMQVGIWFKKHPDKIDREALLKLLEEDIPG